MGDLTILNQPRLPIKYDFRGAVENPFFERFGKFDREEFELIDIFDNNLTFAVYNLMKWKGAPLELAPFQGVILETLWNKTFPIFLASRGASKTFMLAVYSLTRAMLVPGSKIVIVGASFRQSKLVFDYIQQIYNFSPIVQQCTTKIQMLNDQCYLEIAGGLSTIKALPLGNGEKIRGIRACVSSDTLIDTSDGLIEARTLVESAKDYSIFNGTSFETPSHYCRTNITNVHSIETVYGFKLEFSDLHRVMTDAGWKDIDSITTDDRVSLKSSHYFPEKYVKIEKPNTIGESKSDYTLPNVVDESLAKLIGYLLSEGNITHRSSISFTNTNLDIIEDYCNTFESVFGVRPCVYEKPSYIDERGWKCKTSYEAKICRIGVRRFLENTGLDYVTAHGKVIPWSILQSPRSVVVSFLKSLFEGDGTVCLYTNKRRNSNEFYVAYYSASEKMCKQLQTLLLKFGIVGGVSSRKTGTRTYYLRMNRGFASQFVKEIGFISEAKKKVSESGVTLFKPKQYNGKSIKIKSINRNARQDVLYDVCMPVSHSFVGNGLLNHNTDIICDEFASIPKEVFQVVVRGFAAVASDPIQEAKRIQYEEDMIKRGLMKEEDRAMGRGNKIIYAGTAYYQFNHYYELWRTHKAIIESKFVGDAKLLNQEFGLDEDESAEGFLDYRDYAIIQLPYTALPRGFMDEKQISQARATMTKALFQMEYECQFPTDSDGFFKRSVIDEATPDVNDGGFCVELEGDPNFEYVMGVDPARSTDNFAISILKIIPGKGFKNVYCWTLNNKNFPLCVRKIRELLRKFRIVRIAMDAGGGGRSVEDIMQNVELTKGDTPIWRYDDDEHAKFSGLHILDMVNFSSSWIAEANYGLAAEIEHKRLVFPSRTASSLNETPEEDEVWDEINQQIAEMCMIVVTATKTGVQHFDLPDVPNNDKSMAMAKRKDRYSALLLSCYAGRSYISEGQMQFESLPGGWADLF